MILKSTKWKKAILVSSISLFGAMTTMAQELPTRDKIDLNSKWKLEDLYQTDAAWESDFKAAQTELPKFKKYEGKVAKSAKTLLDFLKDNNEFGVKISRLYMYANCASDLDLGDGKYQSMRQKISKLLSDYSAATAFFRPELLTAGKENLEKYKKEEKGLSAFNQTLEDLMRFKPYTLSADEERLVAQLTPLADAAEDAYSVLNEAELPFPTVKGENGEDITISHGRYRSALYASDRDYRERIYKGTYTAYKSLISTFASLYNSRVKGRILLAEAKGFKSARAASMFNDNIPVSVYDNLVKTVNDNIKSQHRWADLKKKILKVNELHPYDTYMTLIPGVQKKYTFEEAKKLCLDALKPMGEEYHNALMQAFDNRWIDVYETKGKRSGAYSNGCGCGVHPWVLLNWNGTLDDVFTLVHELGHNMHSFFTEKTQPFQYTNYTTFVAEVASTTNEALLLDYLIEKATTKEEKAALIEKFLLNTQQTLFRQVEFAEFEMKVHEKAEKGDYLDADGLTKLFAELYQNYWGPSMKVDYEEGMSWARIPHLIHYNFYVYQYGTGFCAAQALAEGIKKEGKPAIDRYLHFLSLGSSEYSIDLLKGAGVDMSTPKPIEATIAKFNKYLDQLEEITK